MSELRNEKKENDIDVNEVDMKEFNGKTWGAENVDAGACLRPLQGEGKINHSTAGCGNHCKLVKSGESKWKWCQVADSEGAVKLHDLVRVAGYHILLFVFFVLIAIGQTRSMDVVSPSSLV